MAVQETRTLPPQFIEDVGTDLAKQLVAQTGRPVVAPGAGGITQLAGEDAAQFAARQKEAQQFDIRQQSLAGLAPTVAGQDALQQQAQTLAQQGIGSYQPFLKFCRNVCPMGCDKMKLNRNEDRYTALMDSCPIIRFDMYLAKKNKVDVDFIVAVKNITTHNLWGKMK